VAGARTRSSAHRPRSASRVIVAVARLYDGAAGVSAQTSVGSRARSAGCDHVCGEAQVLEDLPGRRLVRDRGEEAKTTAAMPTAEDIQPKGSLSELCPLDARRRREQQAAEKPTLVTDGDA